MSAPPARAIDVPAEMVAALYDESLERERNLGERDNTAADGPAD